MLVGACGWGYYPSIKLDKSIFASTLYLKKVGKETVEGNAKM